MIKYIKRYTAIIFFILPVVYGYAQKNDKKEVIKLLQVSKKTYENSLGFKIESSYKLYSTYTSTKVLENYTGVFIKKGKENYSKIENAEFVSLKGHYLHIDNESKLIDYYDIKGTDISMFDFMKFLDFFSNFTITTQGNTKICTLTSPEIAFVPYSKIVICIDAKTNAITKQVMYLLLSNEYKEGKVIKKDYPRLEVAFSLPAKANLERYDSKFILTGYIENKKGKIYPSNNYTGYKVIDSKN